MVDCFLSYKKIINSTALLLVSMAMYVYDEKQDMLLYSPLLMDVDSILATLKLNMAVIFYSLSLLTFIHVDIGQLAV